VCASVIESETPWSPSQLVASLTGHVWAAECKIRAHRYQEHKIWRVQCLSFGHDSSGFFPLVLLTSIPYQDYVVDVVEALKVLCINISAPATWYYACHDTRKKRSWDCWLLQATPCFVTTSIAGNPLPVVAVLLSHKHYSVAADIGWECQLTLWDDIHFNPKDGLGAAVRPPTLPFVRQPCLDKCQLVPRIQEDPFDLSHSVEARQAQSRRHISMKQYLTIYERVLLLLYYCLRLAFRLLPTRKHAFPRTVQSSEHPQAYTVCFILAI
jgi:hypothetical protein